MNKTLEPSPSSTTSELPLPASEDSATRYLRPPGLRAGIWSLALAMAVPIVLMIVFPVGMYFAFGAEARAYILAAQTVFLVPVGACWLAAVVCGLACLRLAKHSDTDGQRTTAWMFGVLGLFVAGFEGLMVLAPLMRS
ncbi:hypothetical protein [Arthrobacter sp. ISL-95]|uniref:hypothetical protein n=1 Tax=Arthrobacter sp. ISL-95 TaxID=2819116 RepID=UPI001BEB9CE8|nr:hypothetical protein [Arthrobacter sp. ISL-95]MBT2586743.1 hypothetical protein [Arthrobacter sp. ISL-95]